MMKNVNNVKVWLPFMPPIIVPLWRLNGIFHCLASSANWIERSSNLFDAGVAQVPGTFLLVDPLKASALYSVTAYT